MSSEQVFIINDLRLLWGGEVRIFNYGVERVGRSHLLVMIGIFNRIFQLEELTESVQY